MRFFIISVFVLFAVPFFYHCYTFEKEVSIFYKERPPSLQVLEKVKKTLGQFESQYKISYYNIEDAKNADLINGLGLPSTHFPFAVVINGHWTAKIENEIISFVHFPLFMKGIGRHEGNWSIAYMNMVLKDNTLLHHENILPVLDKSAQTTSCADH